MHHEATFPLTGAREHMAVSIHLKADPLKGDSEVDKHKGEIQIISWNWGAHQTGSAHVAKGESTGKASFQDISLTKFVDKSSPDMMKLLSTGKSIDEATLTMAKAAGDAGSFDYLTIKLKHCIISSINVAGTSGEDRIPENVTLNFAEFSYSYYETSDSNAQGSEGKFAFSIRENKAQ